MAKYLDNNGLSHVFTVIKANFARITHAHAIADVTNLQTTLDGKAPKAHASTGTDYGKGDGSNYGHVKLSDTPTSSSTASNGVAATPKAVSDAQVAAYDYTDQQVAAIDVGVTGVKGNSETAYRTGQVNLTAANVGAAASSHAHGNITSGGDITATAPTVASGDKLIINDESASKVTNGPSFGTSTTTFLANNGTWQTPAGTVYNDFTGSTASAPGTHGLVPAPAAGDQVKLLAGNGSWTSKDKVVVDGVGELAGTDAGFLHYDPGAGGLTFEDATAVSFSRSLTSGTKVGTINIDGTATDIYCQTNSDTKNTAGSTADASKLYIVGAKSQAANPQTYSQANAYITAGKVYSNAKEVVNLSDTQALTNKTYNGYTLGAACAKAVDTSIATGSTSANLPTSAAVASAISAAMGDVAGALVYKGTVGTGGTVTDLPASHTKGWYYIVKTAGTYAGQACEAGDMVICNNTRTTASNADWDVVQSNIDALTTTEIDALWTAA